MSSTKKSPFKYLYTHNLRFAYHPSVLYNTRSRNVGTNHVNISDKYMFHMLYHHESIHFVLQCISVFHMILAINMDCSAKQN